MPSASHTYIATIVMPVRNGAQYIDGALTRASETCARAGASQVEILVIDDGSTDRTAELASARTGEIPTLRIITSSANAGVAAARELGAIHARGRFIWFVDVDDEWPTDALDVMLAVADGTGADLVLAQAVYLTPAGREKPVEAIDHGRVVSRDEAFGMFLRDEITGHLWNKLATRELAASITYVRTQLHSDQSMVAQLIGGCRVAAITPTIVYRYIQRSGSLVRAGRAKHPSLMLVREVTHEVADQLTPTDQLGTGLAYYDLRSIALPSSEDILSTDLSRSARRAIRRRTREEVTTDGITAARTLGKRREWATGLAARYAPPIYELYLSVQRRRSRIRG